MKFNQKPLYKTALGSAYVADSLNMLSQIPDESIDLVMTSPPFALQRKKEYGNKEQEEYVEWLAEFAKLVFKKLKTTGSFVIDLGGAYQKGKPIRSLYNYRVLIKLCDELGFHLAEEFFWHNPSKRPSGHDIGTSFGKDNGGAIPSNLLQISNSEASSQYLKSCKAVNVKAHPARFPAKLPEFFIKFLTKPNDIIVDIFAGSNTTGFVCEQLDRRWLSFELNHEYLATSIFRFTSKYNDIYDLYSKLLLNAEANINL
jgi:modification methylase pvuII